MPRTALSGPAAAVLAGIAALHVLWGTGAAWPASDRRELADVVAGTDEMPGSSACFAVAAALVTAAAVTAGAGAGRGPVRLARRGAAGVLLVRGVAGITGATGLLVPWAPSRRFQALDRRWYGPLCLGLGSAVALSDSAAPRLRGPGR
jgi:hypothetical protein